MSGPKALVVAMILAAAAGLALHSHDTEPSAAGERQAAPAPQSAVPSLRLAADLLGQDAPGAQAAHSALARIPPQALRLDDAQLASRAQRSRAPAPDIEPIALQAALVAGTPQEREQAAADLGRLLAAARIADAAGAASARQALARALSDPETAVRQAAIESLGTIGGGDAASALGASLHDNDPRVRESAVETLADLGGPMALALLERARNDSVDYVGAAAADAIERLRGVAPIPRGRP